MTSSNLSKLFYIVIVIFWPLPISFLVAILPAIQLDQPINWGRSMLLSLAAETIWILACYQGAKVKLAKHKAQKNGEDSKAA